MKYPDLSFTPAPLAVNPDTAAALIDSTPASLNKDRSVGHLGIPYVKAGKRVMYCVSDLQAWLESRKVFPSNGSIGGSDE